MTRCLGAAGLSFSSSSPPRMPHWYEWIGMVTLLMKCGNFFVLRNPGKGVNFFVIWSVFEHDLYICTLLTWYDCPAKLWQNSSLLSLHIMLYYSDGSHSWPLKCHDICLTN